MKGNVSKANEANTAASLNIVQTTGNSENAVMSQKAMTEEIEKSYELVGENLIDIDKTTTGCLSSSGGILTNDAFGNYSTTDFIKIDGEAHIVFASDVYGTALTDRIATLLYDENKNVISGSFLSEATANYRIINDETATYLRVSMNSNYFNYDYKYTIVVKKGTEKTPKIPFLERYSAYKVSAEKIVPPLSAHGNILLGKKWVACGDSFTAYTNALFCEGIYSGKNKTYPYIIGLRNDMTIVNEAVSGSTMAATTAEAGYFANTRYQNIPEDADYITLWFGINDNHYSIAIGDISDTTTDTFYGAWNVVMEHLITNHPFAKIGIVITNGSAPAYTEAERNIAKKWGVPYLDLEQNYQVPLMHRVNERSELVATAKNARLNAFKISDEDQHPNWQAHEYQSTFIENWLRTL